MSFLAITRHENGVMCDALPRASVADAASQTMTMGGLVFLLLFWTLDSRVSYVGGMQPTLL
jgi:hypothetical protein